MKLNPFRRHVRMPHSVYLKHKLFLEGFDKIHDEDSNNVYVVTKYSEDFLKITSHLGYAGPKEGFFTACLEN